MGLDEVGAMGKDPCAVIAWVGGGVRSGSLLPPTC